MVASDGAVAVAPAVCGARVYRAAHADIVCDRTCAGVPRRAGPVVRAEVGRGDRALLRVAVSRLAVARATVRDLLRLAERGHRARSVDSGDHRLFAECGRVQLRSDTRRDRVDSKRAVGGGVFDGDDARAGSASCDPAASCARRVAAVVQFVYRAGEGHLARRGADRARGISGGAADRVGDLRAADSVHGSGTGLPGVQLGVVVGASQARAQVRPPRTFPGRQLMIRLEKIDKYFGGQRVLNSVDLQLASGNVTALIGPSGSGKSTLLRCVNLLEIPESGSLELGDQRLEFSRDHRPSRDAVLTIRRRTGMVFQNFQLFPHLTVRQNGMEGLVTVLKWDKDKARARADELLEKVGIAQKADAWPSTLSGGQQQRVAIARALAPSPEVLLCDEPTSALDPGLAAEVVEVLKQLATEGMTMMMATHDLRLAATIARDVVFLNNGVVVESGPSRQIFMTPREAETARFVSTLTQYLPDAWVE